MLRLSTASIFHLPFIPAAPTHGTCQWKGEFPPGCAGSWRSAGIFSPSRAIGRTGGCWRSASTRSTAFCKRRLRRGRRSRMRSGGSGWGGALVQENRHAVSVTYSCAAQPFDKLRGSALRSRRPFDCGPHEERSALRSGRRSFLWKAHRLRRTTLRQALGCVFTQGVRNLLWKAFRPRSGRPFDCAAQRTCGSAQGVGVFFVRPFDYARGGLSTAGLTKYVRPSAQGGWFWNL